MAKWKLIHEIYNDKQYQLYEEKITIGRGLDNTITLSSLTVSRHHSVIEVKNNGVYITDLKSSNGTYVGAIKIPQNVSYKANHNDLIGFGWTNCVELPSIKNEEKHIFRLRENKKDLPVKSQIKFENDDFFDDTSFESLQLNSSKTKKDADSKLFESAKLTLKRKLVKKPPVIKDTLEKNDDMDIISLLSDSDVEVPNKQVSIKKQRLEEVIEESVSPCADIKTEHIKTENDILEYEVFNIKQEYLGYDDELIQVDSDSDSDSSQWKLRLSQSSPGKPFIKVKTEKKQQNEDRTSYSQLDDIDIFGQFSVNQENEEEELSEDIISIPEQPEQTMQPQIDIDDGEYLQDGFVMEAPDITEKQNKNVDTVDSVMKHTEKNEVYQNKKPVALESCTDAVKRTQMIEPQVHLPQRKTNFVVENKPSTSVKQSKSKKSHKSSKGKNSISHKEERRKRLKEIAIKDKDTEAIHLINQKEALACDLNKPKTNNIKITSSNRGAFLSNLPLEIKPIKRKVSSSKSSTTTKKNNLILQDSENKETSKKSHFVQSEHKSKKGENKETKHIKKPQNDKKELSIYEERVPLKNLKPLLEIDKCSKGKPISIVGPVVPVKSVKKVHFSNKPPKVHVFEIEPGNMLKKTSLIKKVFDVRQLPKFSLEKITLIKILRWNPHWLDEQINNNEPPPILGHDNPAMTMFHSFQNHNQYVQLVGDLLLMEIWECLTQAYMRSRHTHDNNIQMIIQSLPPVPIAERNFDLFNLSVNITIPRAQKSQNVDQKNVPRVGEVLLVTFGDENAKHSRFFFVHNVRFLPSQNSTLSTYSLSLHATFTDKMATMRPGDVMMAKRITYIQNELMLFEAMEHMAGSPLSEVILTPEPRHFPPSDPSLVPNIKSRWCATLNESQQKAVISTVSAALSDRPGLQMVQGPPGTGKSSVICAIVMTYFYDSDGKKLQNRGKILICATSNPAVDELVIRLLNIRQSLPKSERFRMVRVGRAEAMHARARDVSSQQLAQRDAARVHAEPPRQALQQEISHLQAKINMYMSAASDAKEPARVAYHEGRAKQFRERLALLRGGGAGGAPRPEQLLHAERRIVEGADIVVTTLASAHNHKMRGLKRRIALCIVDEAGQAIEPETLVPLTLDVTCLTLIGDPQQLPGFICSQRAKSHGLGESLFYRLSLCAEKWSNAPVVLLNRQYRMHAAIADYPNRAFYDSRVTHQPAPRPALPVPPYCILGISSGDKGQGSSGANELEAWGAARVTCALATGLRRAALSLAVVTPYHAHKELIKRNIATLMAETECTVEVNTVDSFQGQERDVVIVSLARSHGVGFLTDAGRMNVMLTRARHALLICLNPNALLKNHQWMTLVEDAQKRKMFRVLPNRLCQAASVKITDEEILECIGNETPK